jgi:hypothetical protein
MGSKREHANRPTTGDRTTVAGVVADKLFQKAKFVERDFDLGYDETEGSICKFVTTCCNLYRPILTFALGEKKLANRFRLTSVVYAMTKARP